MPALIVTTSGTLHRPGQPILARLWAGASVSESQQEHQLCLTACVATALPRRSEEANVHV